MNINPMQVMQMLSQSKNPQQMLQNMIQNNPRASAMIKQMQSSGMNAEQYTRQYAKQNNIDIDQIVNNFKNNGMKF